MSIKSRRSGEWLIKEGEVTGANVYKLLQGTVSVYEGDQKINTIEVKEGMSPKLIGVLAALSDSRDRTASVCTDTEIKFETINIDQIKTALKKEVTEKVREDVDTVIKAVTMRDEIKRLQGKIAKLPLPEKLDVPNGVSPDVKDVLAELSNLYESTN
jgi:CRP-like cAMP-binding protein